MTKKVNIGPDGHSSEFYTLKVENILYKRLKRTLFRLNVESRRQAHPPKSLVSVVCYNSHIVQSV